MQDVLYMIVPCFNEENVLPLTAGIFLQEITDLAERKKISDRSRVLFVNDGSTDRTWDVIRALAMEEERYMGISLTRNCGTSGAILAGVREAASHGADMVVSLGCDGQDDVKAIDQMLDICRSGKHIVYAVPEEAEGRKSGRGRHSFLYSLAAKAGTGLRPEKGNYRLLSARAMQLLSLYTETDQDLEGILSLTGLESAEITTSSGARAGGKAREKAGKRQRDPIVRIFDMTLLPLHLVSAAGFGAAILSIAAAIVFLIAGIGGAGALPFCFLYLLLGIQFLGMGVMGEYLGRIYKETKKRPGYLIGGRTWDTSPGKEEQNLEQGEGTTDTEKNGI